MDKSGKRNRFLDALAGRNVQEEPEKFPEIPLKDMVQTLEGVTEEAWGRYAFAREPLERKFTSQEKDAYTVKANACGREWAKRISEKYGTEDPKILAGKMGMKVKMPKVPTGGGVVLFAQYVQPDEITIFTDCVDKAAALEKQCGCPLLKKERLLEILLAHELFHAVEEQYAGEIFTRTEKIELWRKPFSNRSVISCLSEIAAMAFARQLSGLSVSPYMLDVLLVYSYDKNTSYGLYDEIWKWNRDCLLYTSTKFNTVEETDAIVEEILADVKSSEPIKEGGEVYYPGELELKNIKENKEQGIPVIEEVWESILKM